MGLIPIGGLYNPRQGGVPWSQPGGPGTTVFPLQENAPFANYPVPGQFFSESSGLFQVGCGHSVDYPLIYEDQAGIPLSTYYLQDSSGGVWRLGILDNGLIQVTPTLLTNAPPSLIFKDVTTAQTWALAILPNGDLSLTPLGMSGGGMSQAILVSPESLVWALQISNGYPQTVGVNLSGVTSYLLQDGSGGVWKLGVLDNGLITTTPTGMGSGMAQLTFRDVSTGQIWGFSILSNGDFSLTLQLGGGGGGGALNQALLISPGGIVWALQISNGYPQTVVSGIANSAALAIVCCPLCSFIQYVIPLAQYYDLSSNSATPITLI
jgi:hypothetical protein